MNSAAKFFASSTGRLFRALIGLGLILISSFYITGTWIWIFIIIGAAVFIGALANICLLGLLTHKSVKGTTILKKNNQKYANVVTLFIFILGLTTLGVLSNRFAPESTVETQVAEQPSNPIAKQALDIPPENPDNTSIDNNASSQEALLAYLIEEEKLAHDTYKVMYELYGARVFGNILKSETSHQQQVLTLLQERNLSDPRSTQLGIFNDPNLQALYDSLIAQGKTSAEEAYKVGVAIEEKDIADITLQLATATDSDIITTLEKLRSGSENHLRAFNRQLGKY